MARTRTRDRMNNEVNAGSMADIAFLLLIFFLVTTTILEDKGILVRLPPWSDEEPDIAKLKTRNVYSVLVNAQNQLLVRGDLKDIRDLRKDTKDFIVNPERREDLSESPTKAIISLKNDRGTSYETYLEVYNELRAAYNEIWDTESRKQYGVDYEGLPIANKRAIRADFPMIISEAEPTNFGEE
ncbi:MAG: biopolymer transporter ExbD [Saprospiraceae bacterium]|nr:biopolymer transporter ExbD [Saprospiraceae bacterium]